MCISYVSEFDDHMGHGSNNSVPLTQTHRHAIQQPVMSAPVLVGLVDPGTSPNSYAEFHFHLFHFPEPKEPDMGQRHTTHFGRVIRPVCQLTESVAQIETLLGTEPVQSLVLDV